MISLFRRELGKIKYVLCIVLLGFAIPSFLRRGGSSRRESIVARVNGEPISFIEFDRVSKEMESYYQMLSAQFGIPFNYKANEHEVIRRCATEKLTDQLVDSVNLQLDENYFNEQLYNSFLKYFCDESGRVNMEAYQRYLTKINMKINEFEEGQERQLKRSIVGDFVRNAFYSPSYLAKALHDQETMHKKFAVVTLSLDKFLANERHAAASEADLQKYYQIHQEEYRVAEKRKAAYALINPAHLAAGLTVDSEAVENYYSRNKDQFRVPVKIKLRRLVFGSAVAHVDAEAIYAQVKEKPSEFVHFIKTHSVDKDGAAKGGLTGYISKGSIDPQVEEVAFKLKEKGELSELIRTRNGLELVQLEDRIASHEKSFAEVKSEVAQFLIARKAAQHIKSRIDAMNRQIHDGESSEKAFANLCHDMKLSVVESGWLSAHDASGKGLANLLATALFKKGEKLGSFMHEESHVVFLAKGAEKSFIPSFEKIAGKVTED